MKRLVEDGLFGPKTRAMLLEFQRIHQIPMTGELDFLTQLMLHPSLCLCSTFWVQPGGLGLGGGSVPGGGTGRLPGLPPAPSTPTPTPANQSGSSGTPRLSPSAPPPELTENQKSGWKVSISNGYDAQKSLWSSSSSDRKTWEQGYKIETEVDFPSLVTLGRGRLVLSASGEYGAPKGTLAGNLKLKFADVLPVGPITISPYLNPSFETEKFRKLTFTGKAGAEISLDLPELTGEHSSYVVKPSLVLDGNVGYQRLVIPDASNRDDARATVPFEAGLSIQIEYGARAPTKPR